MITVKKDSEVMTNYVAANPVPAGESFGVFHDQQWQPAVFALGEDSILSLIITVGREPQKYDFAKLSGLFSQDVKVQAFAVLQATDGSLDICIATEASNTTSNFYLLHNITLDEIPGTVPSAKVIQGTFPTVDHIYMGHKPSDAERALPLIMVAFQRADRLTKTEDLNYVKIERKKATLVEHWSLPVNPEKILDVTLVTCLMGDGVMVLYQGFSGEKFLVFKVLAADDDDSVGFQVQVPCPEGATCLASFLDPAKGWTVVLVGGKVITALAYKDYSSSKGSAGTVIDSLKQISDLKDLHVSQTGENLRLWYTTVADAVYYYTTKTTALPEGVVIPLLAKGQGGRISSLLSSRPADGDSKLLVSSLLSVDETGNLSLLQQDPASQVWQQYPFWHASEETITEVKGSMVRLHTMVTNDGDGDAADLLPGCWLRVSCSGVVRCIVNGRHTTLSPAADWYQTDAKGVLNILLQTDDATIHQFAADAYRPAQKPSQPLSSAAAAAAGERALTDPMLDPSHKILPKIQDIKTGEQVKNLKKPDGTPLFEKAPDDPDGVAKIFQQLVASANDLHAQEKQKLQTYHATITTPSRSTPVPYGFWSDIGDAFAGAWHWLTSVAEDVWDWTCDLVGGVWKFIVKIGEEIFEIALNTITSIVKGVIWVFKKIGAVIKDIIEFISYLFEWGDILDTTDSIAAGFTAALDYGKEALDAADLDAHKWLENVRSTILQNLTSLQSNDYNGARLGGSDSKNKTTIASSTASDTDGKADQGADEDEVKAAVPYNWSTYYFTYGGGPTNAVLQDDSSTKTFATGGTTEDQLVKLWQDVQDEVQIIMKTVTNVAKDLVEFFNPANFSVREVMAKVGVDLVNGMIDAVEKLSDILFDALKLGIDLVQDLATKEINIPVITWLWKNVIARGRPLTLLNFCALLIAIPTTVLYKAKKKRAPPKLSGRLTKSTFSQYIEGQGDTSLAADIRGFSVAAESGVLLIETEFDMLSLGLDGAFEGLGLESIPFGPVDSIMNVFDSASLTFAAVNGFTTWPVGGGATSAASYSSGLTTASLDTKHAIKYAGWALTGAKFTSGTVVKLVGKKMKLERPVVKRWKGTVSAVLSVPSLCLGLTGDIMDATAAEKNEVLIVNGFIETIAGFAGTWGKAVAQWNDELENYLMYIGLAVYQVCRVVKYGLKVEDFAIEHLD
ncbi:hypothetical protein BO86DRAFT_433701 [Aspergillus japonicus CBS 114.51]|uniref:Uncharacterized protein n=2 Tax=Aspergillus TaxID=5052 RepID=A0A2V5HRU0_ASPV1|nr:hypothetical protein BO86DRAFT_433701 [Aspergillus japonicus CBS 114.51]PYI24824.1 hypothetical protein BO99DRAFT_448631 [Aspergillus violaceofuscus CBS 115571]RAH80109.1 hypothetical protein BO86DRAFT_433701 [Aspergillus japonicus CBS 114.51]